MESKNLYVEQGPQMISMKIGRFENNYKSLHSGPGGKWRKVQTAEDQEQEAKLYCVAKSDKLFPL